MSPVLRWERRYGRTRGLPWSPALAWTALATGQRRGGDVFHTAVSAVLKRSTQPLRWLLSLGGTLPLLAVCALGW